ncbi:MAG: PAS and helix-turn-helix domain-containing protein [Planctomycetes bacterium]|nr:PAS and helix-turn-helix domain-containing protein [Planctomycetota bacterium]
MNDTKDTPSLNPTGTEKQWISENDPQLLWNALTQDAEVGVVIATVGGKILFANATATEVLAGNQTQLVNKAWSDFLPKDVAYERVRISEQVVTTGNPIALVGLIRGICRCALIRPHISGDGTTKRVMIICRPLTAIDRMPDLQMIQDCELVFAECNDLGPLAVLTEREFDVLALIGEGMSISEIGRRLGRSAKTIEWHRRSLGAKLDESNRVGLARIAIRAGLSHLGLTDPRPRLGIHRSPHAAPEEGDSP